MDTSRVDDITRIGVTKYFLLRLSSNTRIKVKVERGEFSFCLNEAIVNQIQQAQATGYYLRIPSKLLVQLGYYACLSDTQGNRLQSGLTFYSYYFGSLESLQSQSLSDSQLNRKMRSVISLDGDVIHQVCQDFLQSPNCEATILAHYWLSDQLLSSLRTNLNILAWELALFSPACAIAEVLPGPWPPALQLIPGSWSLKSGILLITALVLISVLWLLISIISYWLINQLRKHQLGLDLNLPLKHLWYGLNLKLPGWLALLLCTTIVTITFLIVAGLSVTTTLILVASLWLSISITHYWLINQLREHHYFDLDLKLPLKHPWSNLNLKSPGQLALLLGAIPVAITFSTQGLISLVLAPLLKEALKRFFLPIVGQEIIRWLVSSNTIRRTVAKRILGLS